MRAAEFIELMQQTLEPDDEVKCVEETAAGLTVNIRGGPDSCTVVGPPHIIIK